MASDKQESTSNENHSGDMEDSDDAGDNETPVVANSGVEELIQLLRRQRLRTANLGSATGDVEFSKKKHTFWGTQPMPHERFSALEDAVTSSSKAELVSNENHGITNLHAPIEPNKPKEELRQTPYNMPPGFEWVELNILQEKDLVSVYELLRDNYVEDDSCKFRFDYSKEFLMWALTSPGYHPEFHLGVVSTKSKKLVAFISATPAEIRVYSTTNPMAEINFLCIHKKLRSKRLAPVLIKEITRRVNHRNVFQAVYTAGLVIPVPVSTCRYYHRTLEPKKLIEVGFSPMAPRMTMARTIKLYKLPTATTTPTLRPMTAADLPSAHALLTKYLLKQKLAPVFNLNDFEHWFLPRPGVISCYVATNDAQDPTKITDMCSFYHLPSTVIGHPKYQTLNAAYSFYNVATSVDFKDLMNDLLILAKAENQDVVNALNVMDNESTFKDLKFGIGDGQLQYYLYNWSCPTMEAKDIGLVLL